MREPLLFEAYPALGGKIGWVWLDTSPTPVQRLDNLGHADLWIKRTDQASSHYGGNKVGRLEFLLGDAMRKGSDHIVVLGGIGTNLGLAAAIFCRRLGLRCTLLLMDQEVTPHVRKNLRLCHYYGAELRYRRRQLLGAAEFFVGMRMRYPGAYFIQPGGSSPLGVLGTVNAALEFAAQVEQGSCPAPGHVVCPTASNGTMAGLIVGFRLAGLDTRVTGVLTGPRKVGPLDANSPRAVLRLVKAVSRVMRRHAISIPSPTAREPAILQGYLGQGYGVPTAEGDRAIRTFRDRQNIALDPVYTGKTGAAILDLIKTPAYRNTTVLYWHTFNSVNMDRQAESVDPGDLPSELHWVFREQMRPGAP